jgi:hypothetical protein
MNIKVFAYQGTWSWSSHIPTDKMELEIQDWLAKNPRIKVHELKHDLVQNVLSRPQLVVSIYYSDAEV